MESLLQLPLTLLAFVFVLGVVIFVHEAGHMLVAKAFGVRVLTFSLGFGHRLLGFRRGDTDYRISAIPLGGYVRMSGEMPEEGEDSDDPADFLNKPRWQRFLIYLAGPAMNAVLTWAVVTVLFVVGFNLPMAPGGPATVSAVDPDSSAATAGLQPGDVLEKVRGEAIGSWDDAQVLLMTSRGNPVDLVVRRGEETFETTVEPQPIPGSELTDTAGILPETVLSVSQLTPGKPAEAAGFRIGDQLIAAGGEPITTFDVFIGVISSHPGEAVPVEIRRNDRLMELEVTPEDQGGRGVIGLGAGFRQQYSLGTAAVKSLEYSWRLVDQTLFVLKNIFRRNIAAQDALSGPVQIAQISGQAARQGFDSLLHLTAIISISIGLLNLMPIPLLDGGQMTILAVEGAAGRDLPLKAKEVINIIGFGLVMLLMAAVIFMDIAKLF
ncbi:MAG: RIP metalloprotease RseP [Acidobacteriota bacterium]